MQCNWKQCRFEFLLFIFLFFYCRRRWAHMFDFCCCSNCRQSRWKLHGCDCTRKPIPTAQTLIWPKLWKWVSNIGTDTFRWMFSLFSCVLQCINGFAHSAHAHTHTSNHIQTHSHASNEQICVHLQIEFSACFCWCWFVDVVFVAGHCWYFGRLLLLFFSTLFSYFGFRLRFAADYSLISI